MLSRTRVDVLGNAATLALAKLRGLVQMVAVVRLCGPEGLGVFVQVQAGAGIIALVTGLGTFQALVQFARGRDENDVRRSLLPAALLPALVMALPLIVVAALLGSSITARLDGPWAAWMPAAAAVLGAAYAVRLVLFNLCRARGDLGGYARRNAVAELLEFAGVMVGAVVLRTAGGAVVGAVLATGAVTAWHGLSLLGGVDWTGATRRVRPMLRYSLPLVPTQVGEELMARADRLLVGTFLGAVAAGAYSALYAIASLPQLLNSAITTVLFPRMVLGNGSAAEGRRAVRRSALIYGATAVTLLAMLAPAAPWLVRTALGADALPPDTPASLVTFLAGAGVIAFGAGRLFALELFVARRTDVVAAIWLLGAVVNLAANAVLLPRLELVGAGLATVISYAVFLGGVMLVRGRLRAAGRMP